MRSKGHGMVADPELSHTLLEAVLRSDGFRASPQSSAFLRYVVTQEIEGRGDTINAYAIGVDALGKPTRFDPQTDSSVRVQAGRVRAQLADYYRGEGRHSAFEIVLPKGHYRPRLAPRDESSDEPRADRPEPAVPSNSSTSSVAVAARSAARGRRTAWLTALAASALGLVALTALLFLVRDDDATLPADVIDAPPIVEISKFGGSFDKTLLKYAQGIRQQLIAGLSHFHTIRVRADAQSGGNGKRPPPADYRMTGTIFETGGIGRLTLQVTETRSNTVVWSNTSNLPTNDEAFHKYMSETARAVISGLASPAGLLPNHAMQRLNERIAKLGKTDTSSYECVLLFHLFDLHKNPEDEAAARACLAAETAAESQDSSIWAAWAFMRFFDWTKHESAVDDALLSQALTAARRAIRLEPTNALGHEYLGAILAAKGERAAALAAYQRAMELNPSNPDLYVHFGWYSVLEGNWQNGVSTISEGIAMSPAAPGWMHIPLSMAAFRREDYRLALTEAETVLQAGDQRGLVLALAAASALGDRTKVRRYLDLVRKSGEVDPSDPMRQIRKIFNSPDILRRYGEVISSLGL